MLLDFFGSRETMWSIKLLWRPSKWSPAAGDNFGRLVSIQQLFAFGPDTTVYHHPQSRGITGLLDMKRLLFALSLARRTGHSVNPQPFDWLYLPRSLLLTIAFSKRYFPQLQQPARQRRIVSFAGGHCRSAGSVRAACPRRW